MADLTQFDLGSARRIAGVVRKVEQEPQRTKPLEFGSESARSAKVVRMATFTGAWAYAGTKTVTFRGVTSQPNTAVALNLYASLDVPGTCDAMIARAGTAGWHLVQPGLQGLRGYSSQGTVVLSIVNGSLRWVGTTACT